MSSRHASACLPWRSSICRVRRAGCNARENIAGIKGVPLLATLSARGSVGAVACGPGVTRLPSIPHMTYGQKKRRRRRTDIVLGVSRNAVNTASRLTRSYAEAEAAAAAATAAANKSVKFALHLVPPQAAVLAARRLFPPRSTLTYKRALTPPDTPTPTHCMARGCGRPFLCE